MQLVDTQRAREAAEDELAVLGEVELGDLPAQAVVDEAGRQLQQEVAAHGLAGALDVEAVFKETVEDGAADGVVVIGLGRDVGRVGAKGLAAGAARPVLCVGELEPDDAPVGEGADAASEQAAALAGSAAGRAGSSLG